MPKLYPYLSINALGHYHRPKMNVLLHFHGNFLEIARIFISHIHKAPIPLIKDMKSSFGSDKTLSQIV